MAHRMTGSVAFRTKALTIACTDLRRSARFYEEVLGAVPLPTDGYGCPWYRLGSLAITLMPNASERSPASYPEHAMLMLWLEVDDLPTAERRFAEAGVEIVQPSEGQLMIVADPDGLLIEVWQGRADADE
jgi:catechol 2,3-dioxygenase-like lactoylglutathione lyase family enzyme